ncbi:small trans-membrane and glycosylated protein, isoform CRA_a [Homo sapiens]|uniref:LOC57228 protein n=1 Tax=Homo sapiens TaxID=9606 RepID=O95332_HUMAN
MNLQKVSPVPSSRWRVTWPRAARKRNISSNDSQAPRSLFLAPSLTR